MKAHDKNKRTLFPVRNFIIHQLYLYDHDLDIEIYLAIHPACSGKSHKESFVLKCNPTGHAMVTAHGPSHIKNLSQSVECAKVNSFRGSFCTQRSSICLSGFSGLTIPPPGLQFTCEVKINSHLIRQKKIK